MKETKKAFSDKETKYNELIVMCDKSCSNCSHSKSMGTWLKCTIDSKEVSPNGYCSQYN